MNTSFLCKVLPHNMCLDLKLDITGPSTCRRCGYKKPKITWKRPPMPPPPPMPRPKQPPSVYIGEGLTKPPPGPPGREFRDTLLSGMIETKESKQKQHEYEIYMKGWSDGFVAGEEE